MSTKKQPQAPESAQGNSLSLKIKRFAAYVEDAKAELRKVTWPTLPETRRATFVVLGFVAFMAVVLGLIDLGLSKIIQLILA